MNVLDNKPQPQQKRQTIPNFRFEDGTTLDLQIAYWSMGALNADGSNVLLVCHGASGSRDWALPFCRPGGAFDPTTRLVVSVDLPGGGDSSRQRDNPHFPSHYSLRDLTNAMSVFLDAIGAKRHVVYSGVSVSTLIGFDLTALRPDFIAATALWNCAVRCDGYAQGAIDALVSILNLDSGPAGMSAAVQSFYPSLTGRDLLAVSSQTVRAQATQHIAKGWVERWTASEIVARYVGTISGDVTALHGGEIALAQKLTRPLLLLPSSSDQLLPATSILEYAKRLPSARTEVCKSDLGHQSTSAPAGSPEFIFYDSQTANFFREFI